VVDVIQGGAGTSTNMNANEVIANRALEHLGRKKGDYAFLHPNDHVNMPRRAPTTFTPRRCAWRWVRACRPAFGDGRAARAFAAKAEEFRAC
jgi:aspartate ammonia-lyase